MVAAGGAVVEALLDSGQAALDAWINTYDLKISVVHPKQTSQFLTDLGPRETAYVIDLSTMKIVWTGFGSFGPTDNSSAKQAMAEMAKLLGN